MKSIFILDVDNTIVPFQPTKLLYQNIFLKEKRIKYLLIARIMIALLRYFWIIPGVVKFQRKWIMSLFSRVDQSLLEIESKKIASIVLSDYKKNLGVRLEKITKPGDSIFFLSHCPQIITEKLAFGLSAQREYSIPIQDYLKNKVALKNFDKEIIIKEIKKEFPQATIYFFADDLIDLKALKVADKAVLVNGSMFTKIFCKYLAKDIEIWD